MLTVPMHRLGGEGRGRPHRSSRASTAASTARRTTATGSGSRRPATACAAASPLTGNDPNDANVANSDANAAAWAQHLVAALRARRERWSEVLHARQRAQHLALHASRRPSGRRRRWTRCATRCAASPVALKTVDPGAAIVGPEEWGWSGYLLSGYDQQYGSLHGWSYLPDRTNHGGMDYLPWLLQQLQGGVRRAGRPPARRLHRPLLPAGRRVRQRHLDGDAARRNRSTRSLWDPTYVDETWINDRVQLIPRLRIVGEHLLLPGHADRHHRVQLGRRERTSTAPRRRPTSSASSAARGSTWPRAGRRPTRRRPPTRR